MKVGHAVRITNLSYFNDPNAKKRNKSLVGKEGKIVSITLGIFKVQFDNGEVDFFDGRELEFAEKLEPRNIDLVFVSWQKDGKSVYDTEEGDKLFIGDFHHGTVFKGTLELDEEEASRVKQAWKMGIHPVFDIRIRDDEDKRKNRRDEKPQTE